MWLRSDAATSDLESFLFGYVHFLGWELEMFFFFFHFHAKRQDMVSVELSDFPTSSCIVFFLFFSKVPSLDLESQVSAIQCDQRRWNIHRWWLVHLRRGGEGSAVELGDNG